MRTYLSTAVLLGVLTVLAFSQGSRSDAQGQKWGTVKGQIVWGGDKLPVPVELTAVNNNNDKMHCLSKGKIFSEEWVIKKENKGVRWVVISLKGEGKAELPIHPNLKEVSKTPVVMDQPCCKFEDHVVAMREGQQFIAKNSSPVTHNVNWQSLKNSGNKLLPPMTEVPIPNLRADVFPVNVACNIHPWMKATVYVFNHPYYAVTDENGQFEIKDAPAGKCRMVIWHEANGWHGGEKGREGREIEVKADGVTDVGKVELK